MLASNALAVFLETWRGARRPRGIHNFSSPLSAPENHGQTFAELPDAEKSTISHRARAMEKVKELLTAMRAT